MVTVQSAQLAAALGLAIASALPAPAAGRGKGWPKALRGKPGSVRHLGGLRGEGFLVWRLMVAGALCVPVSSRVS